MNALMTTQVSATGHHPVAAGRPLVGAWRRLSRRAAACAVTLLAAAILLSTTQPASAEDAMTIDKDGNVGIGTTDPGQNRLQVNGGPVQLEKALTVGGASTFQDSVVINPGKNLTVGGNAMISGKVGIGMESGTSAASTLEVAGTVQLRGSKVGTGLTVDANGNVGIGTAPSFGKLDVNGVVRATSHLNAANDPDSKMNFGGSIVIKSDAPTIDFIDTDNNDWSIHVNSNKMYFVREPWEYKNLVLDGKGYVGIGTDTPQFPLDVSGFLSTTSSFLRISYNSKGVLIPTFTKNEDFSIRAEKSIASGQYFVFSDARIKKIAGLTNSRQDLQTLLGLQVTDYTMVDRVARGGRPYKKLIAQQVEEVFPQAVSKHTDVVPDIYKQSTIKDGWVALATDLKKGERVKLISEKGEGVHEVLEVTKDKFRTDFKPEGDKVFVFGREVNDFRTVDYEAIAMLNISATQQIKKELGVEVAEVQALKAENAALRARLDTLEAKVMAGVGR